MKSKRLAILLLLGLAVYWFAFLSSRMPSIEDATGLIWRRIDFLFFLLLQFPNGFLDAFFGNPAQFSFLDRLPILTIAGLILGLAACVGWLLMLAFRANRRLSKLETFVFAEAVGLNAISTYVLLAGLMGCLNRTVFIVPSVLIVIVAVYLYQHRSDDFLSIDQSESDNWFNPNWLWMAVPFALMIILGAMLPPIDFDVREYHLQVPKEFFQQGHIAFLPHNVYGNMPLSTEMLSLLAMVLADDWWIGALTGKTVIGLMAPLTALALLAAGRRFLSTSIGVIAAVLYISVPWIVRVSTTGLVEGVLAFYVTTSVYAVLLWTNEKPSSPLSRLALSGYLIGSAVSCKYPAVLFLLIPLAGWVFFSSYSSGRRDVIRSTVVLLLATVVGCGLWFGKNWILTGNPTYPLLYYVFGGETRTPEMIAQWNAAHSPKDFSLFAIGKSVCQIGVSSEWLSPLIMPLAVLALLVRRHRRFVLILFGYFGYVIITWWLFTHRIDRFWLPAMPLLALLAGVGVCWSDERWWRRLFIVLFIVGGTVNFLVDATGYNHYFVSLQQLRHDKARVDSWHEYFNSHVKSGQLLTVGEAQVFDLEVPVLYNTCFDTCLFEELVKNRTPKQVRTALIENDISFIFVHWAEIDRYRRTYGFTEFVTPEVFQRLVKQDVIERLPHIDGHTGQGYRVLR